VRVIGGEARGRPLKAPASAAIRPTSDRVREAMFDVLMSLDAIEDASVLDCFAGSGALGIEALSRGAATVTFVDSDRESVSAVEANLERVGFARRPGLRVVRAETLGFLASSHTHYDLALVDPPYRFAEWGVLLDRLRARTAVLESKGTVEVPERFTVYRTYRHGGTILTVVTESDPPEHVQQSAAGMGEEAST
jgi:16S rRNA (guanine966-N2)-methyltransferase